MGTYWRYEKYERKEWLDNHLKERVYAHRHGGLYFAPDDSGEGLKLISVYYKPGNDMGGHLFRNKAINRAVFTLPSEVDGKPVTTIGKNAFFNVWFNEIVLPESVRYIEDEGFRNCDMDKLVMPGVRSIGKLAFLSCKKLITAPLPPCLESIAYDAFTNCPRFGIPEFAGIEAAIISENKSHTGKIYSIPLNTGVTQLEVTFNDSDYFQSLTSGIGPITYTDEPSRWQGILPEVLLIDESRYRPDDKLKVYYPVRRQMLLMYADKEKARKLLTKQSELLKKYLGIRLKIIDSESQLLDFFINVDPKDMPGFLSCKLRDTGEMLPHYADISSSDMPTLVRTCNKMISEYMDWCRENGEDIWYALVLPCGKTPNLFNEPCPCEKSPFRELLIPERLADEWAAIDEEYIRSEFFMYLRELHERGDLIIDSGEVSKYDHQDNYEIGFDIPGLAFGSFALSPEGCLFPDITSITNGVRATVMRGYLEFADSLYPSTLNDFCDMPPEAISEALRLCIPKLEKATGIHRTEYKICGRRKTDPYNIPSLPGHEYSYLYTMIEKRKTLLQGYFDDGKFIDTDSIFPYGIYEVATIRLKDDGSWDISEIISYSERQQAEYKMYCAERYGWK